MRKVKTGESASLRKRFSARLPTVAPRRDAPSARRPGAGGRICARHRAHRRAARFSRSGHPIDVVSGTSVGALIATGYCAGTPLEAMQDLALQTKFSDFGRWAPSWLGLATNYRLEQYLSRLTPLEKHLKTCRSPWPSPQPTSTRAWRSITTAGQSPRPCVLPAPTPVCLCRSNTRAARWWTAS